MPLSIFSSPIITRSSVLLPPPLGPINDNALAGLHFDVDALEHLNGTVAIAFMERLHFHEGKAERHGHGRSLFSKREKRRRRRTPAPVALLCSLENLVNGLFDQLVDMTGRNFFFEEDVNDLDVCC